MRFGLAEKAHKRIAALDLVNQQMKVYFRLNTIRLSAALVSAVEGTRAMPFESFPASARVTYKYYTGRIAVFDENFVRPRAIQPCCHKLPFDIRKRCQTSRCTVCACKIVHNGNRGLRGIRRSCGCLLECYPWWCNGKWLNMSQHLKMSGVQSISNIRASTHLSPCLLVKPAGEGRGGSAVCAEAVSPQSGRQPTEDTQVSGAQLAPSHACRHMEA